MSCYRIVLIFWLSVCTQELPMISIGAFQRMKRVLIVFNMFAYLCFIGVLIIALDIISPSEKVTNLYSGAVSIGRDFLIAVIYIVFLSTLRLGITDDASAGESIDERKMVCFTVALRLPRPPRRPHTRAGALFLPVRQRV
jgi:hypothetical protein